MQVPTFPTYRPGPLGALAKRLYADASLNPLPTDWRGYPLEAGPLIACLMRGRPFRLLEPDLAAKRFEPRPSARPGDKRVIVGFSGGKDSAAAAIKLQAQGLEPVLFHCKGLNRAYPGEQQAALKLAGALKMKIVMLTIRLHGKSPYIENPAKNQFILALMADYGGQKGIGIYAQGNMTETISTEIAFEAGFSDSIEMYQAAEKLLGWSLPGFRLIPDLLKNDSDSLMTIVQTRPEILPAIQSCMTGPRFRAKLRETNQRKFGVDLMPERCGSCYKCGLEWLHLALIGAAPWRDGFAEHSLAQLIKWEERNRGKAFANRRQAVEDFFDLELVPRATRLISQASAR